MALNLQTEKTKILYLPLKNEQLPNLQPHTTLKQSEHSKLNDIKSNTFDVCTGITKQAYSQDFLCQIFRTLKPGGIIMVQIAKEIDVKKDLLYSGFSDIESKDHDQITHWTARKPRSEIKAAPLKPTKKKPTKKKSKLMIESKSDDDEDDGIITHYKTTKTSFGRFCIPYNDIDLEELGLNGSTLILPTVGVGNIAQIAMDILLTTLISKRKIIKIGYINDRNVIAGVGNDGLIPKQKKRIKNKIEGILNVPIEVYWYKECNLVFIQQRCALRIGGRGEFVDGMIQFIDKYKFDKVIVMTSEYITKRNDVETKNNVKFVYYHTVSFNNNDIMNTLKWIPTIKIMDDDGGKKKEKLESIEEDEEKKKNDDIKHEFNVIGHGITKKLYIECNKRNKNVIVICQYSEDGDNTTESEAYLNNLVKLIDNILSKNNNNNNNIKLGDIKKWKHPFSLSFANGGKLPNGIY